MRECEDCYRHESSSYYDYCSMCGGKLVTPQTTFARSVSEAHTAMEARFQSLEADVKRLKRELGLK